MSIAIGIEPLKYKVEIVINKDNLETRQPIALFNNLNDAIDYLIVLHNRLGGDLIRKNLWYCHPVLFLNDSRVKYTIRDVSIIVPNNEVYNWVK